jgi:hypothetical protein
VSILSNKLRNGLDIPTWFTALDQPAGQKLIDFLEEEPGECRIVFLELIFPDSDYPNMYFYRVDLSRAEPIIWRGDTKVLIRMQLNEQAIQVFRWKRSDSVLGNSPTADRDSIFWPSMSHSAIAERLSAAFERLRLLCQQQ